MSHPSASSTLYYLQTLPILKHRSLKLTPQFYLPQKHLCPFKIPMGTLAKDIPIHYPNFSGHLMVIWTFWSCQPCLQYCTGKRICSHRKMGQMPAVILTTQGTPSVLIILYLVLNNQLVNWQAYGDISPHRAQSGSKCPNHPPASSTSAAEAAEPPQR